LDIQPAVDISRLLTRHHYGFSTTISGIWTLDSGLGTVDPAHAWPIAVRVSSLPLHAHKAQLVTANYDGMGWSKREGAAGWDLTLSGT